MQRPSSNKSKFKCVRCVIHARLHRPPHTPSCRSLERGFWVEFASVERESHPAVAGRTLGTLPKPTRPSNAQWKNLCIFHGADTAESMVADPLFLPRNEPPFFELAILHAYVARRETHSIFLLLLDSCSNSDGHLWNFMIRQRIVSRDLQTDPLIVDQRLVKRSELGHLEVCPLALLRLGQVGTAWPLAHVDRKSTEQEFQILLTSIFIKVQVSEDLH